MTSPFAIKIMLACYYSPDPAQELGIQQWSSSAGVAVRDWLRDSGLIGDDNRATDRGKAWVKFICATPLPEATWMLPDRVPTLLDIASAAFANGQVTAPAEQQAVAQREPNLA